MAVFRANVEDMEGVIDLISCCIKDMAAKGNDQWGEDYPDKKVVAADMLEGSLYLWKEKDICQGMIVLNEFQNEEYQNIAWANKEGKILVVHRLAVHPEFQRQGIAGKLMDFAEGIAVTKRYVAIRLDTYSNNPAAINFYKRRGYNYTGEIYFPHRSRPFYGYEKMIVEQS